MTTEPVNTDNKKSRKIFYIVLIIVLLVINALLFYNNLQTRSDRDALQQENTALEEEQRDLEAKNEEFLAEISDLQTALESEKGINEEMDAEIDSMQHVLEAMKQDFRNKINNKEIEASQLRKELNQQKQLFENLKNEYLARIDELEVENEQLKVERAALQDTVSGQTVAIREMEEKLSRGEVLSVKTVNLNAYKVNKRNGKEKQTDNPRKADKLKICFSIAENRIAEPGYKPILVKITNPEGTTLAIEAKGSGNFELAGTGEQSLYTKKININYDPSSPEKEYCTEWFEENGFVEGIYDVELFHEGYKIGDSQVELKRGFLGL